MNDAKVLELVSRVLDSGCSPEDACRDSPSLLGEVRHRLRSIHAVDAHVDALFPASESALLDEETRSHSDGALPHVPGHEVLSVLGHGGMGVVYAARHLRLNRTVAVKMILGGAHADLQHPKRLLREAEAVAALRHPNIVQVHEVGDHEGLPYFTMELVEGGSLREKLAEKVLDAREAASLVSTLAEAMEVAHASGIVHRDLKPANVLLTPDGTPKIVDFGLARWIAEESSLTLTDAQLGTPSYMAPEQARGGSHDIGPAADVYALGAILYATVTGRPPFKSDGFAATLLQVIQDEPVHPSRLNSRVPRDLETICLACLKKDPQRRYPSARALADDLQRFLRGEPIVARPVGPIERFAKLLRRRPVHSAAVAAAIVAVAAVLGTVLWTASQHAAIERAVAQDLAEAVRFEEASNWRAARNTLELAKTRLGAAGGSPALEQQLSRVERELDLVDRLSAVRLERTSSTDEVDQAKWWRVYLDAFLEAGLVQKGDSAEALAARVAASSARTALIAAMDDWSICATNRTQLEWILNATRLADPDPAWRDRARDIAIMLDPNALAQLAREVALERQPAWLLLNVAGVLSERGSDEALPFLRRIQAAHPSDFWVNFGLGELLEMQGDRDAVGYYQAAIALRPDAAVVHVSLAMTLESLGRVDESIECLRRAIALDPNSAVAHGNLALWLIRLGHFDDALVHAETAVHISPGKPEMRVALGQVLLELGRHADASACLRRGIEMCSEDPLTRTELEKTLAECEARSHAPAADAANR